MNIKTELALIDLKYLARKLSHVQFCIDEIYKRHAFSCHTDWENEADREEITRLVNEKYAAITRITAIGTVLFELEEQKEERTEAAAAASSVTLST